MEESIKRHFLGKINSALRKLGPQLPACPNLAHSAHEVLEDTGFSANCPLWVQPQKDLRASYPTC